MRYVDFDAYRRTIADRAFWRGLARRTIQDGVRAIPDRVRARRTPVVALTPPRRLGPADVPLLLVARNSAHLLPSFVRHYRGLGVTRFIVLDDRSSDGTREMLAEHADVDLWSSSIRYGDARHGLLWRERLVRTYGRGRWYVNVDADEFLVYEGMGRHRLPELFGWLERKRLKRLLAPMLDLYPPAAVSAAVLRPGSNPWDVATHFDASGYRIAVGRRTTQVFGGPRARVFGVAAQMVKFPVLYWDRRTFFTRGPHAPLPYLRNFGPVAGALLHFKYFSDFRERVDAAVRDNQYWREAAEYRAYRERLCSAPDLVMAADVSRRYAGVEDLVALGLVASVDWPGDVPRTGPLSGADAEARELAGGAERPR